MISSKTGKANRSWRLVVHLLSSQGAKRIFWVPSTPNSSNLLVRIFIGVAEMYVAGYRIPRNVRNQPSERLRGRKPG